MSQLLFNILCVKHKLVPMCRPTHQWHWKCRSSCLLGCVSFFFIFCHICGYVLHDGFSQVWLYMKFPQKPILRFWFSLSVHVVHVGILLLSLCVFLSIQIFFWQAWMNPACKLFQFFPLLVKYNVHFKISTLPKLMWRQKTLCVPL